MPTARPSSVSIALRGVTPGLESEHGATQREQGEQRPDLAVVHLPGHHRLEGRRGLLDGERAPTEQMLERRREVGRGVGSRELRRGQLLGVRGKRMDLSRVSLRRTMYFQ